MVAWIAIYISAGIYFCGKVSKNEPWLHTGKDRKKLVERDERRGI
jgi:hypothetical protein